MAIKSIVVKRKPINLAVGQVVHTCQAFGSKTLVIIDKVEKTDISNRVKVQCIASSHDFYVGRDDYIYLGDLGVPGHAYDNRPCSLFSSRMAAVAHGRTYWDWLTVSRYNELRFGD